MKKIKVLSYFTGAFLALIGISGVACGLMLIINPDGSMIQLPLELIENTPFNNYLIPGIALFAVNGLCSLVGAWLACKQHRLSGVSTILLGIAMLIWITAEVYWVGGESFLQPTMVGVGVIEIILGLILHKKVS